MPKNETRGRQNDSIERIFREKVPLFELILVFFWTSKAISTLIWSTL